MQPAISSVPSIHITQQEVLLEKRIQRAELQSDAMVCRSISQMETTTGQEISSSHHNELFRRMQQMSSAMKIKFPKQNTLAQNTRDLQYFFVSCTI